MKDALALALVHFLWQGALLGALGWGLMRLGRSASVRYTVGVGTLAAMLAAPVLTMVILAPAGVGAGVGVQTAAPVVTEEVRAEVVVSATPPVSAPLAVPTLPANWILAVWLVGVGVLSARVAGGWFVARRLITSSVVPVARDLEDIAASLANRLALRRAVRVLASSRAVVPVMAGWWRPVVLIPVSALSGMPLTQIEALLAHEFAHIRRHDYLVNLLQTMVETVCFYHPAVWLVSRDVRRERELCCDDLAIAVCDRVTYVTALAHVASMATPRLAMAANGGSLRDRIQRLIDSSSHAQSAKGGWMAMLPLIFVLSLAAPHAFTPAPMVEAAVPVAVIEPAPVQSSQPTREEIIRRERAIAEEQARARRAQQEAEVRAVREMVDRAALTLQAEAERLQVERRRAFGEERAVQERRDVRNEVAQAEIAVRRAELEIETSKRALERTRELATKGLATNDAAAAAEVQLQRAELELASVRANLQAARERAEQEVTIRADQSVADRRAREALRSEVSDQLDERRRVLRGSALPEDATLRASDMLVIVVDGEPDLPRNFTVREDGSIRFPFLGAVRVQGSTARQVQSAIAKLLADKNLASNPAVTVTARGVR
jgi:beta-lactamase regulating signal transducer with metallopeptidase domain